MCDPYCTSYTSSIEYSGLGGDPTVGFKGENIGENQWYIYRVYIGYIYKPNISEIPLKKQIEGKRGKCRICNLVHFGQLSYNGFLSSNETTKHV